MLLVDYERYMNLLSNITKANKNNIFKIMFTKTKHARAYEPLNR